MKGPIIRSFLSYLSLLLLSFLSVQSSPISVSSSSSSSSSPIPPPWKPLNPLISGANLNSIAFGGGVYVAVGEYPTLFPVNSPLVVVSSTDLITWNHTLVTPIGGNDAVVYYEEGIGFLILPFSEANIVYLSTSIEHNGKVSWTSFSTPTGFYQCASGRRTFLCQGERGSYWTSTDIANWKPVNSISFFLQQQTIPLFLNDSFFIHLDPSAGDGIPCVYSSETGVSDWELFTCFNDTVQYQYPLNQVYDLKLYNSTTFIASIGSANGYNDQFLVLSKGSGKSLEWIELPRNYSAPRPLQDITIPSNFPGLIFAREGDADDYSFYYSSKDGGESWSEVRLDVGAWELSPLAVSENVLVVVGPRGLIQYTKDGRTWNTVDNGYAPMTNFQLLVYPSNSTGSGFLTVASNGTSNENTIYQSQDNGLSWSYVSSTGYESLQWGPELNVWFSYNPGLQYSTDLRSWTQIYITAPYNTPIVQFLGYWPGSQQDSAGWVVGTGYQTDSGQYGFEFLFCNQILSGDCEIVEQTEASGSVALGDSVLVLATGSYINSTSLPFPHSASVLWKTVMLPISYQTTTQQPMVFFNNGLFFYWTTSYVLCSGSAFVDNPWNVIFDYSAQSVTINLFTYLTQLDLYVMVDSTGTLYYSSTGREDWSSEVISSVDSGIDQIAYSSSTQVFLVMNSVTDQMYFLNF